MRTKSVIKSRGKNLWENACKCMYMQEYAGLCRYMHVNTCKCMKMHVYAWMTKMEEILLIPFKTKSKV